MDSALAKSQLRHEARERRGALAAAEPDFAQSLAAHADALPLKPGSIIGGYHALSSEADPALLLRALVKRGHHIAFPRVVAKGAKLAFHRVPDGEMLRTGAWGIQEPAAHFPVAEPDLLLVPLLAFDQGGHRLGYGGGFYDRTIAALKVPAFGIGFAGQVLASLPVEAHDMALDGILTENGLTRFS
ncbi:MAG: 5-formyltetrahydrofolate cyclo-ligase [Alphaproteobacteria bacterium]|nr:5-formyltetrahydrofolate cyclo-ligase [Alphaproteobacteria bacterium]